MSAGTCNVKILQIRGAWTPWHKWDKAIPHLRLKECYKRKDKNNIKVQREWWCVMLTSRHNMTFALLNSEQLWLTVSV